MICRRCGARAVDGRCTLCGSTQVEGTTPPPVSALPPPAPPGPQVGSHPPGTARDLGYLVGSASARVAPPRLPVILIAGVGAVAVTWIVGAMLAGQRPSTTTAPVAPPVAASASTSSPAAAPASAAATSAPTSSSGRATRALASGSWIAVLESLPKDEATEEEAVARAAAMPGGVVAVDTDHIPGLNADYWALAIVDAPSEDSARASCARAGREVGPACYPREIG